MPVSDPTSVSLYLVFVLDAVYLGRLILTFGKQLLQGSVLLGSSPGRYPQSSPFSERATSVSILAFCNTLGHTKIIVRIVKVRCRMRERDADSEFGGTQKSIFSV